MNHRSAPLPSTMRLPAKVGVCRWCGEPINEPRRRWWHKACALEYLVTTNPRIAFREVARRDGLRCADCGWDFEPAGREPGPRDYGNGLELEHIIPLLDVPRELKYWLMGNLQLLCHECHVRKTARNNRNRKHRQNFRGLNLLPKPMQMELEAPMVDSHREETLT